MYRRGKPKRRIHSPAKWLAWLISTLVVLYIGASWFVLEATITPKRITNTITPDQVGLQSTESVTFRNQDDGVNLQGWLIPAGHKKIVILVHGVHSQAWDGSLVDLARYYVQNGIDVLLFDLRGHGWSGGTSVGLGIKERGDVQAAVDVLMERGYLAGKIGIHGLSYGAAVSLMAAAEVKEIGAVIADSSFGNVLDVVTGEIRRATNLPSAMAETLLPGIRLLARLLYDINIDESAPEKVIGDIAPRPVLLIHGIEDDMIPFQQARRLQAVGDAHVELWALKGYRHAEGLRLHPGYPEWSPLREQYLSRVTAFFESRL